MTKRIFRTIPLNLIFFFFISMAPCLAKDIQWPVIKEFTMDFPIQTNAEKLEFVKPLDDMNGTVKYLFVCRGGSTEYLDKLSDQTKINYVGVLGCRLIEGNKEEEYSLLAEDDDSPWHTRGQYFTFNEVTSDCGNYPEFGRMRHFRLRGFELTLLAKDFIYNKTNLNSFKLQISLRQDPKVKTSQAEQTGYITPYQTGRNCKIIIKGNEPRMCRNWEKGGSWEECKK
ncbi:MAG: hypothetical protein HY036_06125 [Nitrospirae bacterium]|nr:hypothetical protein [Nitrospirota bacterium]